LLYMIHFYFIPFFNFSLFFLILLEFSIFLHSGELKSFLELLLTG
jgi:hypothetical protein